MPAVLISGISKGGFGGGVGLVAVPLMALVISPVQAAGIMLPILCMMDLFGVWAYRRRWDGRNLRILLPAALLGIAVGTASFRYLDGDMIRLMLGVMALAFVARAPAAGRLWRRPARHGGRIRSAAGSGASSPASPPSSPMPADRRSRSICCPSAWTAPSSWRPATMFYITVNYVKLVPYGWLGQLSTENLATAAVLAPLVPIGMGLGLLLHRRVSDRLFYRICYALLAADRG